MRKSHEWLFRFFVIGCLLVFCCSALAKQSATAASEAQAISTPVVTEPPRQPLASQLGQTLETLVGITSNQPAPTAAPENIDEFSGQIADTFVTRTLASVGKAMDVVTELKSIFDARASFVPDALDWFKLQQTDSRRAASWNLIGTNLLGSVAPPLLAGIAFILFLIPLRLRVKRNKPRTMLGRIGLIGSLLFLRLIPVLIFLGSSLLLLEQNETHKLPLFVVSDVIYAISIAFAAQQILRAFFSPTTPHLRTLPLSTEEAVSGFRWSSAFCIIIVYAYFLIDIATAMRAPQSVIVAFQNFCAAVLASIAGIVVFKARSRVANVLRGQNFDDPPNPIQAMRLWLSRHWHGLAIVYIVISLLVTFVGNNSLSLMLRGTVFSVVILVAVYFGFVLIEKWKTPLPNKSALLHRQVLSFVLKPAIWVCALLGIGATWGVNIGGYFSSPSGQRLLGEALSIAITLSVLTVLYELFHNAVERYLNRQDKISKTPVASARARTLLPMVRTSIFVLFSLLAVLISLSVIGVNIAPLLAGAGVVGVAIGFGSQTLVKDFLTGLFIVAENTIAVGDVVKIDTFEGTVETLSFRAIRLRDVDGSLHILPFSEVSKISNRTRDFAYALIDVGVAYDSDLKHVMRVLSKIGEEIREDPALRQHILEPIEVLGVQELGASSISVRVRMRARPGKQWEIRRALLLRIKLRFDEENIEIPFPTVTQIKKTHVGSTGSKDRK